MYRMSARSRPHHYWEKAMNRRHWLALAWALTVTVGAVWGSRADAGNHHYYSSWHPSPYHYYYRHYYYQPNAYDYVIYYPKQPRYLYFYNPVGKTYWGRFDVKTKLYSLLAEADRKGALKDIPEEKFPEEGALPNVHGDAVADKLEEPPLDDLPPGEDLGTKTDTTVTADQGNKENKTGGDTGTAAKPQPVGGEGVEPAPKPTPQPAQDGGNSPAPAPKPGTTDAPAPGPGPGPGTTDTPAPKPGTTDTPAPKPGTTNVAPAQTKPPAPQPSDLPPFQLPAGYGSCERNCPKK
jgi:hypothetical protein